MCIAPEWGRGLLFQLLFDSERSLARGEAGTVADPEDMCIHREGLRAERGVHHHIGGLSPDTGELGEHITILWHLTTKIAHENL